MAQSLDIKGRRSEQKIVDKVDKNEDNLKINIVVGNKKWINS